MAHRLKGSGLTTPPHTHTETHMHTHTNTHPHTHRPTHTHTLPNTRICEDLDSNITVVGQTTWINALQIKGPWINGPVQPAPGLTVVRLTTRVLRRRAASLSVYETRGVQGTAPLTSGLHFRSELPVPLRWSKWICRASIQVLQH